MRRRIVLGSSASSVFMALRDHQENGDHADAAARANLRISSPATDHGRLRMVKHTRKKRPGRQRAPERDKYQPE